MPRNQPKSLQQAGAVVFVLMGLLPLLIFAWTLYRVDAIHRLSGQVGLALSLLISLLGFHIFRGMMHQVSELIAMLAGAADRQRAPGEDRRPAVAAPSAAGSPAASASAPTAVAASASIGARATAPVGASPARQTASASRPAARSRSDVSAPGVGAIRELADVARTMAGLWKREATPLIGQRVAISVANAAQAIRGTLTEVTDDGLLVDHNGLSVAITYRRISAIEPDRTH